MAWVLRWVTSPIQALHSLPQMWQVDVVWGRVTCSECCTLSFLLQCFSGSCLRRASSKWATARCTAKCHLSSLHATSISQFAGLIPPFLRYAFKVSLKCFLWSPWDLLPWQLGVEHLFWNTSILHMHTVASPAKLVFHDLCFNTGGLGCRQHISICVIVVPSNVHDPP